MSDQLFSSLYNIASSAVSFVLENESILDLLDRLGGDSGGVMKELERNQKLMTEVRRNQTQMSQLIGSGFDRLENHAFSHAAAIEELRTDFNWRMNEVQWNVALHNEKLDTLLLEVRKAEFERESRAFREKALDFLSRGLESEALEYFLQSLNRNKVDFATQLTVGKLYLRKGSVENAVEHLMNAVRYARAYDAIKIESVAYLHLGLIEYIKKDFNEAINWARKSVDTDDSLGQGFYDLARYQMRTGSFESALKNLEKSIDIDPNYARMVANEVDFFVAMDLVGRFFIRLLDKRKERVTILHRNLRAGFSIYPFFKPEEKARSRKLIEIYERNPNKNFKELEEHFVNLGKSCHKYFSEWLAHIFESPFYTDQNKSNWPRLWAKISAFNASIENGFEKGKFFEPDFNTSLISDLHGLESAWQSFVDYAQLFVKNGSQFPLESDGALILTLIYSGSEKLGIVEGKRLIITKGRFIYLVIEGKVDGNNKVMPETIEETKSASLPASKLKGFGFGYKKKHNLLFIEPATFEAHWPDWPRIKAALQKMAPTAWEIEDGEVRTKLRRGGATHHF
jgi:tetratricopeptide (TPR) repeat protein